MVPGNPSMYSYFAESPGNKNLDNCVIFQSFNSCNPYNHLSVASSCLSTKLFCNFGNNNLGNFWYNKSW